MEKIYKYPRTKHIKGSCIQKGDEDLNTVDFDSIKDQHIVIEEKVDGANCGISFDEKSKMYLQSRGHFLVGGYGERQFDLFKTWANSHKHALYQLLGHRYILYGEWLYAKHTVYYDQLSHYFMEFDIYDKEQQMFLSTRQRKEMLKSYKFIVSVLVLFEGKVSQFKDVIKYLTRSNFKSLNWLKQLENSCGQLRVPYELTKKQTDLSQEMEGLYIKMENEEEVLARCKYVRQSFTNTILDSETHWINRPIIPNQLREGVDIFKG